MFFLTPTLCSRPVYPTRSSATLCAVRCGYLNRLALSKVFANIYSVLVPEQNKICNAELFPPAPFILNGQTISGLAAETIAFVLTGNSDE
jgi:hypothetical protein